MGPRSEEEALAFLSSLPPSTIRLGLDRVETVLAALGHPEGRFRALHVAGTNGKGSTCAFLASVLLRQGYRVGLYTSPHLVRVNERIKIDGRDIDDGALGRQILEVLDRVPEMVGNAPPLSYFELGTVVAFRHFAEQKVDVAVLETGLGGRLDATNVVRPLVCGVTSISLDHQEHLGDTLAQIAREKAGIFKKAVPALSSRQPDEVRGALQAVAEKVGTPLQLEGDDFQLLEEAGGSYCFEGRRWRLPGVWLGLPGPHQRHNAALALGMLEVASSLDLEVSEGAVRSGLEHARWPGRLEEVLRVPLVVLDGAHNPAGVKALLAGLDALYPRRRVHLVFGALADKDLRGMIGPLFPRCASVHLAPLNSPRSAAPGHYLEQARQLNPDVTEQPSVAEALEQARALAQGDDLVLCAGSLVLVGEVKRSLEEEAERAHGSASSATASRSC